MCNLMSLRSTVWRSLGRQKDAVVDQLCRLGLIADPQTLTVGDVSAVYRVTTASERWRVKQAMGERPVLERFLSAVQPGDCVWDVGAAVGTYACLAGNCGADVVAFEPHPGNRQRCRENLDLNNIAATVRDVALSDENETMSLAEDAGIGSGMHRLAAGGDHTVETIRGDAVDAPAPDVLKIDVEGHEIEVLEGLGTRLESAQFVLVECHPEFGAPVADVRPLLENTGYDTEVIDAGRIDGSFLFGEQSR